MLDRIPTPGQEGRVLVTPENGGAPFYAKIQMADNPLQVGDPFAKMTMLHDAVAAAYDKDDKAVPNDIFEVLSRFHKGLGNEYVWAKQGMAYVKTLFLESTDLQSSVGSSEETTNTLRISKTFEINNDGTFSLTGQIVTLSGSYLSNPSISGYVGYYGVSGDGRKLYEITSSSSVGSNSVTGGYVFQISRCKSYVTVQDFTLIGYVNSPDPNAYPIDDGYTYTALGQLGAKIQIASGSYTGTGTYGERNPNNLTFDFSPKFFFLIASAGGLGINASNNSFTNGFLWIEGQTEFINGNARNYISVEENAISWYSTIGASQQYNNNGTTYNYLAIG